MLNKAIITEFEKLVEQIKNDFNNAPTRQEQTKESFRLRQIKAALQIIKNYPNKITSGKQLASLKGIGPGTISRIDEILSTGQLSEIKVEPKYKKNIKIIEELEEVFGIGRQKAHELISKHSIKSVKDLKKAVATGRVKVSEQILIGLKYHNVYKQTIPRSEIDKVNIIIQHAANDVDLSLTAKICGSYRRGKPTSNDIDILIHHPDVSTKKSLLSSKKNYLHLFIKELKKIGFILDDLTFEDYHTKYMGYCRLDAKSEVRRLDVYYTPAESYYTSLLHLTGSGEFNRKMRSVAIELGYKLNEYGLFDMKNDKEKRILVYSEEDIFEKLGMEYLSPDKR